MQDMKGMHHSNEDEGKGLLLAVGGVKTSSSQ